MGPDQSCTRGALPRFGKVWSWSQTPPSQLAFLLIMFSRTPGLKLEKFKYKS